MSRTNPRSVILAALQEEPRTLLELTAEEWCLKVNRAVRRCPCCIAQRHLCKLIRSRKVVRLGDGRYALRWPRKAMLGGKITIYLNGEDAGTVQVNPGDAASDVQAQVDAYIQGAVGSLAFIQAYPEGKE